MKIWMMITEDLFARSEACEPVSSTALFFDEKTAIQFAEQEAEMRGWEWSDPDQLWYDADETAGTIRVEATDVVGSKT